VDEPNLFRVFRSPLFGTMPSVTRSQVQPRGPPSSAPGSPVAGRIGTGSSRVGQVAAKSLRGLRYEMERQVGPGCGDVGAASTAETDRPGHDALEVANLVDLQ
jgi:hypothetical protein